MKLPELNLQISRIELIADIDEIKIDGLNAFK